MKIREISSFEELKKGTSLTERSFLLLYRSGSDSSMCALSNLDKVFMDTDTNMPVFSADVDKVKDIHPEFGINSVPVLMEFREGSLTNLYKGCNSPGFYLSVLQGVKANSGLNYKEDSVKRVTVYSTPTCTWCNTLKTYLREQKIVFRDIDVSADQRAAEEMVRKSGQQGVPQTDINGELIIGFDRDRIDHLLNIRK